MTGTTLARGGGLWPAMPVTLSGALAGALDTSASSSTASSSASSSTASSSGSSSASSSASSSTPAGAVASTLPSWLQYVLFHDWFTGQDGRATDTSVKSLLVLVVFVILGAGFIYFGVKTLAE